MTSSKSSIEDLLGGPRSPMSFNAVTNSDDTRRYNQLDSWVDIRGTCSQGTVTPVSRASPHSFIMSDEYLLLLSEAQRESNQSSAKISLASSRKNSPRSSPKSPPNSPVHGTPIDVDWSLYYLNREGKYDDDKDEITSVETYESPIVKEYNMDYSSRPQQVPPKYFVFRSPKTEVLSIRHARMGDTSFFSKKGLYALFLTNIISVLIGTGIGIWLTRHGVICSAVKVR